MDKKQIMKKHKIKDLEKIINFNNQKCFWGETVNEDFKLSAIWRS